MTRRKTDSRGIQDVYAILAEQGFDGLAEALEGLLNEAMKLERAAFLGAGPYERNAERRGYANGFKGRRVDTRVGQLELAIPQVRDLPEDAPAFYPRALEKGLRSERALKAALAEMYVHGVSTRKVLAVTQKLCGLDITASQVSRATQLLDEELSSWRERPLEETPYVVLDARYERIREGGSVIDCAVLVAIGVRADGKRSVLGVSVSLSEAELHWRAFLRSLKERGLRGVQLVISDDHAGLKAALKGELGGVPWQRCQCHLQRNAAAYVPKVAMRAKVAETIRSIFNSMTRQEATERLESAVKTYSKTAPRLAAWMESALPEGLTVLDFPAKHRRRLRTTNCAERVNQELKRRTRVATLFPNEASLLRLVSAVLMEITEEWETGRTYLDMSAR